MFENILYATDFSESPLMLPCVGIIGKTKKIHLLHVIDEGTQIDPALFEPRMLEAKSFLEEALKEKNKSVEVDVHVMPGAPARDICNVANSVDASLIVINYHTTEGVAESAATELIKFCHRNILIMTRLASDSVDRSMDTYCTGLFRHVVSPANGNDSFRLEALKSLKGDVSLGTVTFSYFSDDAKKHAEKAVSEAKAAGINAALLEKKAAPRASIVSAAEQADASLILLDAMAEMGLAISVVGSSEFPILVLKSR